MNFPVFDFHCDTALRLLGRTMNEEGSLLENEGHIDLKRASTLSGYCQCFACFTTPAMADWYQISPTVIFERELATIQREVSRNQDLITLVYTADEIAKNQDTGKMSAVLTIEGAAGFGYDAGLLKDLYKVGFRITSLGWNESNSFTGSHVTGEGLSEVGKDFVREAQRLGMLVDVSHISDRGFWDIMQITTEPIVATHSNSRAVCKNSRNLTDEMFRAICETGGVAGINQFADFLGDKPTLDTICDHVLHFLELDPEGKHIALGGDLDGCDALAAGFTGVESYPAFAARLLERGIPQRIVMNIFWNNALRVLQNKKS